MCAATGLSSSVLNYKSRRYLLPATVKSVKSETYNAQRYTYGLAPYMEKSRRSVGIVIGLQNVCCTTHNGSNGSVYLLGVNYQFG